MAFVPSGFQPVGHEPEGHHPGGAASGGGGNPAATAPGSAASTLDLYASSFQVDQIANSNSETDAGNRYTVCMRSGFRVKPNTLIEDAYGALVRPDSFDRRHPQELIRPLAEKIRGPKRPEPTDQFLSASVSPEDL